MGGVCVASQIHETMAMTSSMATAVHTTNGMAENASKLDPETGYCYKNGWRPPYGYMLRRVLVGKDRRGKDKYKLLWEVNPQTSQILRRIVVSWRVDEGLSYDRIRDQSISWPGGTLSQRTNTNCISLDKDPHHVAWLRSLHSHKRPALAARRMSAALSVGWYTPVLYLS